MFKGFVMKKLLPAALAALFLLSWTVSNAQLLKRIKDEVQKRAENNVVNKAGNTTDKTINSTADAAKKEVTGSNTQSNKGSNTATPAQSSGIGPEPADYKNYDFVPGDKIIFQPDLSNEHDAELPSRFTVETGNAEIQTQDGEKILHLEANSFATVAPLMNSDNYLPEQFTLEFDMMY